MCSQQKPARVVRAFLLISFPFHTQWYLCYLCEDLTEIQYTVYIQYSQCVYCNIVSSILTAVSAYTKFTVIHRASNIQYILSVKSGEH